MRTLKTNSMYIIINTNESKFYLAKTLKSANKHAIDFDKDITLSQQISVYLNKQKTTIELLTGILVIQGKGGFSDTRHGAVFANIMAYARSIPVASISEEHLKGADLSKLFKSQTSQYIKPEYSGPPNIG